MNTKTKTNTKTKMKMNTKTKQPKPTTTFAPRKWSTPHAQPAPSNPTDQSAVLKLHPNSS